MGTDVLPKFPVRFVSDQTRNSIRTIFCSSWHLLALAPATMQACRADAAMKHAEESELEFSGP